MPTINRDDLIVKGARKEPENSKASRLFKVAHHQVHNGLFCAEISITMSHISFELDRITDLQMENLAFTFNIYRTSGNNEILDRPDWMRRGILFSACRQTQLIKLRFPIIAEWK